MENLLAEPAAAGTDAGGADARPADHRIRLMEGMAAAVDEKGYGATTIADIVRHARVSKRTFYEHFADREQCFLACYSYASDVAMQAVRQAAESDEPWPRRVRDATHSYLSSLQDNAVLTRTLLVEVHAAGPRALALRRTVLQRFATLLCDLVEEGRRTDGEVRELTPAMSTALVGGINELVLCTVEQGGDLTELEETVAALVEAVLTPPR